MQLSMLLQRSLLYKTQMNKKETKNRGELIIYSGKKGGVELRADTDKETINPKPIVCSQLFMTTRTLGYISKSRN